MRALSSGNERVNESTLRSITRMFVPTGFVESYVRVSLTVRLALKRVLDVSFAAILLLFHLPVLAVAAAAIRVDSRGPVLFTQARVGMNRRREQRRFSGADRRGHDTFGSVFSMYKFRTMRVDAPPYAVSPQDAEDQRITRVGRFMRRTCLDELPQLINVIRGEMSFVGPRPEMPFIVSQYNEMHRRRLLVRPGITGLWQIEGPRDRPIHEAIEWDITYIENWSLRLDFVILLRTLAFVIRAHNF